MQPITPIIKKIIIIHVCIFLAQQCFKLDLIALLGLKSWYSSSFKPYQLFTYLFAYHHPMELISTLLILLVIGTTLERVLSSQQFITAYLFIGIGSAVLYAFVYYLQTNKIETLYQQYIIDPNPASFWYYLNTISPKVYQNHASFFEKFTSAPQHIDYINQSKAIAIELYQTIHHGPIAAGCTPLQLGILAMFTVLFPNKEFLLFFLIPIKAKYFLAICILYELFISLYPVLNLGGMLCGALFIQWWKHQQADA